MKPFKLDTQHKITSGFTFPESYFDNFSQKVTQQLPEKSSKFISFYAQNQRWIYSAAAILVIALTISITYQIQNNEDEISTTEVENYLIHHTNLCDDDVLNLLNQDDIEKLQNLNKPLEGQMIEDVLSNNIELEEYISSEN